VVFEEEAAHGEAWLGIELGMAVYSGGQTGEFFRLAEETGEFCGRAAEGAGYVNLVTGFGSGAEQGAFRGDAADEDNVGEDEFAGGFGSVPASERDAVLGGESKQAREEARGPGVISTHKGIRWHSQREKCGHWGGTHGGEVTQTAGERAMANRLWWMGIAAEMSIFKGKIGRNGNFTAFWRTKQGAVVANAKPYCWTICTDIGAGAMGKISDKSQF